MPLELLESFTSHFENYRHRAGIVPRKLQRGQEVCGVSPSVCLCAAVIIYCFNYEFIVLLHAYNSLLTVVAIYGSAESISWLPTLQ